jgi:hypothetical protein
MDKRKLREFVDSSVNAINPRKDKVDHLVYNYGFLLGVLTDILYDDVALRYKFIKHIEQLHDTKQEPK